jgi:hypothetical protein
VRSMYNRFGKFAIMFLNQTFLNSTCRFKLTCNVLNTLVKPEGYPIQYANFKTGYITISASNQLTLFEQNSIKGCDLFIRGDNFFNKPFFDQKSFACEQTALKKDLRFKTFRAV